MTLQLGCAEPSQHRRTRDTPDVSAFDQKAIEAAGPSLILGVRIPHVLYVSPSGAASSLARISRRAGVHWIAEPGAVPAISGMPVSNYRRRSSQNPRFGVINCNRMRSPRPFRIVSLVRMLVAKSD